MLLGLLGALIVIIVVLVFELNSRPDLNVWHTTELSEEFRAESDISSFDQYLAMEERLFEQLDRQVYQGVDKQAMRLINRYNRGSLSDPDRWPTNWNRTFVLPVSRPEFGVLLLHGMSDSPYSLRSTGELLHEREAYVIGLRVPGHGQAPSGLLDVEWQDMAAAVQLAMQELYEKSGGSPLIMVGYSNGGALAVNYTLNSLRDVSLKKPDGIIMISPAIGISKLAALAVWQERLGHLLGLEKLAWNSILPEYDPWKYGSFALNAGDQAHRITREIQRQISEQTKAGTLGRMPPILAFQSVVDATVSAPDLVRHLFARMPEISSEMYGNRQKLHELVLFDINRFSEIDPLMKQNPSAWIEPMIDNEDQKFKLTLMSNKNRNDQHLVAYSRMPGSAGIETCDTGLSWPADIYSLSHVALPIPPDDPVYGVVDADESPGISLGQMALRGERNILQISAANMLRLRYNPFHSYMEQRILAFLGLLTDRDTNCLVSGAESGKPD
jgi:alpha-beta hydrolase superfamily lysophospholipase